MNRAIPPEEEMDLVKRYLDNPSLSVAQLARDAEKDRCTVARLLRKNNVTIRGTRELTEEEKNEIVQKCSNENGSISALAEEYQVNLSTIYRILKKRGVFISRVNTLQKDAESIVKEYFETDTTHAEIAKKRGYARSSITHAISKAKVTSPDYQDRKKSIPERKIAPRKRLPISPQALIEEKAKTGLSYRRLAQKYGVSESCIYHVFARSRGKN